jgi:hypothetical protein
VARGPDFCQRDTGGVGNGCSRQLKTKSGFDILLQFGQELDGPVKVYNQTISHDFGEAILPRQWLLLSVENGQHNVGRAQIHPYFDLSPF